MHIFHICTVDLIDLIYAGNTKFVCFPWNSSDIMYITFICVSSFFRLQLSLSRTKSRTSHCDINKIDSIFTVVYNMSYFSYCYAPVCSLFFFFSFLQQLSGYFHFTVLGNDMIAIHLPLSWIMSLGGIKVLCWSLMAQILLFTVPWYQIMNNGLWNVLFKSFCFFFCWSTQLSVDAVRSASRLLALLLPMIVFAHIPTDVPHICQRCT